MKSTTTTFLTGFASVCFASLSTFAITPDQITELINRSPVPSASDYKAIVANGTTVIAIGQDGSVSLSRNSGVTWTTAPPIPDAVVFDPPTAIATDGTRYVVVALGKSYVSTDLETWSDEMRILGGGYDLTFGAGRFVTVGGSASIFHSTDGETWTAAATVPSTEDLRSIATDGSVFVAGGSSGQLLRSTDGDTWSVVFAGIPGETGSDNTFTHVSYANNLFLATARNNILYTSPNGITWTARDLSGFPIGGGATDIVYDGSQYIISGGFSGSAASTDLATFTEIDFDGRTEHLAESGGAVITASREGRLATFAGTAWTERSQRLGEEFDSVVFINGLFYISDANTGRIFSSRTGSVWSFVFQASSNFRSPLAFGGSRFMVLVGNSRVVTSTDGITWTESAHDATGVVDGLTYLHDRFILFGRSGNIHTGIDGTTWTKSPIDPDFEARDFAYGNGLFVAAGSSHQMYTTPDFVTWTPRPSGAPDGDSYVGVEFAGNRFVALQRFKPPAVSNDGISWSLDTEARQFHLSTSFTDPAANGLGLYTFGTLGRIRYFPDPTDISDADEISYPSLLQARGLAAGNGVVVLVGSNGLILTTPGAAAGYEGWALLRFPLGAANTGPGDDFDADGLPNVAEYARGTDPTVMTPKFLMVPVPTAFGPEITWTQRMDAPGVTTTAEFSSDLLTWSSSGVLRDVEPLTDGMERITARLTGVAGTQSPLCVRILWTLE